MEQAFITTLLGLLCSAIGILYRKSESRHDETRKELATTRKQLLKCRTDNARYRQMLGMSPEDEGEQDDEE